MVHSGQITCLPSLLLCINSNQVSAVSGNHASQPACRFHQTGTVSQVYISALDEDLGKAQARMDVILATDGSSTTRQNELLKAAAKQVSSFTHSFILSFTHFNVCLA